MISYEWDCEQVDKETGDIVDHFFGESLEQVQGFAVAYADAQHRYDIVLVRRDENDRCTETSWAYMKEDGTLPDHFTNANDHEVAKVPKKFHKEASKAAA